MSAQLTSGDGESNNNDQTSFRVITATEQQTANNDETNGSNSAASASADSNPQPNVQAVAATTGLIDANGAPNEDFTNDNVANIDTSTYFQRLKDIVIHVGPLGFIAFGGPTAHTAILHERFVDRLKWVDKALFLELFSVSSALPGPSSTQLVVAISAIHAGISGALLAFILWSLPSFVVLIVTGVISYNSHLNSNGTETGLSAAPDWMAGFSPAAVALVIVAASQLSKNIASSNIKIAIATFSIVVTTVVLGDLRIDKRWASLSFPILLFIGGLTTLLDSKRKGRRELYLPKPSKEGAPKLKDEEIMKRVSIGRWVGGFLILSWLIILVVFVALRLTGGLNGNNLAQLFEAFYRIGSIIYGGGHVVLPMMLTEVVTTGWLTEVQFYQGFALAQAMPGPLFTLSAFLGGAAFGVPGAFVGFIALFAPGVILVIAFLPFWAWVRKIEWVKIVLQGTGAAGVGLIMAACIDLWEIAVRNSAGAAIAVIVGVLVGGYNVPAPIGILLGGLLGWILSPSVLDFAQTPYVKC